MTDFTSGFHLQFRFVMLIIFAPDEITDSFRFNVHASRTTSTSSLVDNSNRIFIYIFHEKIAKGFF